MNGVVVKYCLYKQLTLRIQIRIHSPFCKCSILRNKWILMYFSFFSQISIEEDFVPHFLLLSMILIKQKFGAFLIYRLTQWTHGHYFFA